MTAPGKISDHRIEEAGTVFCLTLREGKKRQIRRMCRAAKLRLISLERLRHGPIRLEGLEHGKWRFLTEEEVSHLDKEIEKVNSRST